MNLDWEHLSAGPRPPATHEQIDDLRIKLAAAEWRNDELTEGIRVNNEAMAVLAQQRDQYKRTVEALQQQIAGDKATMDLYQRQRDEAESAISRYEKRVAELETTTKR